MSPARGTGRSAGPPSLEGAGGGTSGPGGPDPGGGGQTARDSQTSAKTPFATALYQEKAWQAQSGIQGNAASAVAAARARFEAGDIVRDDLARAEMGLAGAKVESLRTESLRGQALLELASAMGDATLVVRSLAGSLDLAFELPALESLVANLPAQPENALAEADLRARRARVDWGESGTHPRCEGGGALPPSGGDRRRHHGRGSEHPVAVVYSEPGEASRGASGAGGRRGAGAGDPERTQLAVARVLRAARRGSGQRSDHEDGDPGPSRHGPEDGGSPLCRRRYRAGGSAADPPAIGRRFS